jgi:hypothetical protein
MDDEFKTILEKFAKTIDELGEFKTAAAKVLGKIAELGDISSHMTTECNKADKGLTTREQTQTALISDISAFTKKIDDNAAYERELGAEIKLLNKNFQGVLNLSKQLSDGLVAIQSAVERQIKASADGTDKAIIAGNDYILSRLDAIEKLNVSVMKLIADEAGVAKAMGGEEEEKTVATVAEIVEYINGLKAKVAEDGKKSLVLQSGDIHRQLKLADRMPMVCNAMQKTMAEGDKIINTSASGYTSALQVEYKIKIDNSKKQDNGGKGDGKR